MSKALNWGVVDKLTKQDGEMFYIVRYRGKDKKRFPDNKKYVLKSLANQKDRERRSRMLREISNLRSLDHYGIPKIYDTNVELFDDMSARLFFVTEYVEGDNLREIVKKKVMKLDDKIKCFINLINIMEYCHENGVLHQNINPTNILCRNGNWTDLSLIDYGLSFNINVNDGMPKALKNINQLFLSLPELGKFQNFNRHDPRSDIALCCGILFYLITELYPMYLLDHYSLKPHQRAQGRSKLKEETGNFFDKFNRVFDIGFNVDIDKRFQSFEALRLELMDVLESSGSLPTFKEGVQGDSSSQENPIHGHSIVDNVENSSALSTIASCLDNVLKITFEKSKGMFSDFQLRRKLDFEKQEYHGTYEWRNGEAFTSTEFRIILRNSEVLVHLIEKDRSIEIIRMPVADYEAHTLKLGERVEKACMMRVQKRLAI